MEKELICEQCLLPVKYRDDLVTVWSHYKVRSYHEKCYAKSFKGIDSLFTSHQPINGLSGNLKAIFALVLALLPLFVSFLSPVISAVCLLIIVPRLYSFFLYERKLPQ
jgi:hypothetical protein